MIPIECFLCLLFRVTGAQCTFGYGTCCKRPARADLAGGIMSLRRLCTSDFIRVVGSFHGAVRAAFAVLVPFRVPVVPARGPHLRRAATARLGTTRNSQLMNIRADFMRSRARCHLQIVLISSHVRAPIRLAT
jgi:hypothetical protein